MTNKEDQYLDIKAIVRRVLAKKYYFIGSLFLALLLGWLYLHIKAPEYSVGTTLLLRDQGLSDKGSGSEKFMNGMELMENDEELEDAIGILTSFSMVRSALEELNFEVSYYQYPSFLEGIPSLAHEILDDNLSVTLASDQPQLLNVPVHLRFLTDSTYQVEFDVDRTDLYYPETREVKGSVEEVEMDTVATLGEPFQSSYLSFTLTVDEALDREATYYFTVHSLGDLTDHYQKKLAVKPIAKESNMVSAVTNGSVVEKEKMFLNTLGEVYIATDLEEKNQLGRKTITFIDRQLGEISDSLRVAEGNLESFRAQNQIVDISTTSETLAAQVEALEKEKAGLVVQDQYLKFLVDHLNKSSDVSSIVIPQTSGISDPTLSKLIADLSDLNRQKISMEYNISTESGLLDVLNRRIAATKAMLVENLDSRIGAAHIALKDVNRRIREAEKSIDRLPSSERSLVNIDRKFTFNDNIYNYLLEKKAEAGIALASNVPDKTVIDAARLLSKKPVSPKKWLVYALALLAGLMIPAAVLVAQDLWNDTISEQKDLQEITDIPLLGSIIHAPRRTQLMASEEPHSPAAESFRFVRVNLQFFYQPQMPQVIGITSSIDGEGKTYCSANLAAEFATSGKKTLLIAGDLRKPKQQDYFTFSNRGVVNYLASSTANEPVVQSTHISNLDILASGPAVKNSAELLESGKLGQMMTHLRQEYDQIIVDTPPVNYVVDYFLWQPFFDMTLMVVRQHYTNKEMIERSTEMLKNSKVRNLAMLLNHVNDTSRYRNYHEQQPGTYIRKRPSFRKPSQG